MYDGCFIDVRLCFGWAWWYLLTCSCQVIRLLGVCTVGEELLMVLELASRGDLKHFLLDCRPTPDTEALLTSTHLARMSVDVANGMVFLSSSHLVHRDLACRYVSVQDCIIFRVHRQCCLT